MARFERHGSELAARPDVAVGGDSRPPRIVRHSPPGGPKLEVQHGPACQ